MNEEFDVVLRGYDRKQVDAFFERLDASAVTAEELQKPSFRVAMIGYDRHQVWDAVEDRFAGPDGEAEAHAVVAPAQPLPGGPASGREFDVVLRGYDRHQVNVVLARVDAGTITAEELRQSSFTVAMRGYDRHQVWDAIKGFAKALEDGAEE
ncbi:DivIVA domain-containing protein [Planotetraspora mira]|uniref:DivIVA domain-containing protein n=1 Tax=Planotetraspora mira TaxID=58121 RepID=UPI001950A9D9|nr:DivIVA domain-containing protein [Planotetraspora mira]